MENQQSQNWFNKAKPFMAVVSIQLGYAIMDVMSKAAMNKGMSNYVFVVYRHAVAFFVIAPFAFYFDKYWLDENYAGENPDLKVRPKMTLSIFMKIMVLSLIEPVIDQNLYFLGMKYTTASFAAAMTNILPAITFIFACILRLEKIKIKSIRSQAKVVGTLATVCGAMVMTLMKGAVLYGGHGSNSHIQHNNDGAKTQQTIMGSVMIIVGCFCWACFVILQAITLKAYPAALSLSAWICLMGTIEGSVVAMIMERGNLSVWSLNFDMKLLCAVYTGIVCSGVSYYLQGVVMKTRGPVFVTAFSPLCMVIVAILGSFFLSERLYLGRVIGAIVICLGLYLVVWGKSKDYSPPNPITQEPILPNKQIADEDKTKENCTQEVITVRNFGTLDEQV